MTKEAGITILKKGLLGFVLITIGFTIGKEVTLRRIQPSQIDAKPIGQDQVVVSYVHATIRCVTCNTIERLVKETLDEGFADAVAQKQLRYEEVDFQQNTAFAKQYEIVANCVVLRQIVEGNDVRHVRLDKVWQLYDDPKAFKKYLADAIQAYLNPSSGDSV